MVWGFQFTLSSGTPLYCVRRVVKVSSAAQSQRAGLPSLCAARCPAAACALPHPAARRAVLGGGPWRALVLSAGSDLDGGPWRALVLSAGSGRAQAG
jgi:hypothetical protein